MTSMKTNHVENLEGVEAYLDQIGVVDLSAVALTNTESCCRRFGDSPGYYRIPLQMALKDPTLACLGLLCCECVCRYVFPMR